MSSRMSRVIVGAFVVNLGVALGAGLYESVIVVPEWLTVSEGSRWAWNPEAAAEADTGRRFWVFVSTGPLTVLALANLLLAFRTARSARRWLLPAALISSAERVFTLGYFIPTMIGLSRASPSAEAARSAATWAQLNHLRHALTLAALLLALRGFAALFEGKAVPDR